MGADRTERSNTRWLEELRDDGPRGAAVADLRRYLHRGLAKAFAGRAVGDADLEDFAQDAVIRVLATLDTFRGESRFTTWAMAVAVRVALGAIRRRRHRELREDSDPFVLERAIATAADDSDPAENLDRKKMLVALRVAIANELTERQRTAVLGELAGVPTDLLAERLGLTRNALYKLHHDARRKLRRAIIEADLVPGEVWSAPAAVSEG
jgi:RNA polymerase sigma-70 factor (ECF subfamily)